ncbi:DUF6585 family protein [Catellatospora coxensis]|uniref:DUF6585 family protein n=1 Tax=Catellatospora coxensis TaxID=310354 RepID=UPI001943A966|nr:DUF6585 family protein [Catellatospora coxensis]
MVGREGGRSIEQAVTEAGLGELRGRYRPAIAADIVVVVCVAALALLLLTLNDGVGAVIAMGVGVLALAAIAALVTWRKANTWLHLYTGGTLTVDPQGTATSVVTWQDVAHLRYWTRVTNLGTAYVEVPICRLDLTNGEVVDLSKPRYKELPEIVSFVDANISAIKLPLKIEELRKTGAAVFGPITLAADGVRWRDSLVPWHAITRVEAAKTRLKIWTDSRRPAVSQLLSAVPELTVLIHMFGHWQELQQPDPPATSTESQRKTS